MASEPFETHRHQGAVPVKERLDLRYHTGKRPWQVLCASLATGYLLGRVAGAVAPLPRAALRSARTPGREQYPAEAHLATYLRDHLAGAVTAMQLLKSLEKTHEDLQPKLATLRADIEQDYRELKALMRRLNVAEAPARKLGGWFAEKATQLKVRIDDRATGPLRLLESLELVSLGIEGKLGLWRALAAAAQDSPALRVAGYERLANRAMEQRQRAEALRLDAARMTLSVPLPPSGSLGDPAF
jgi:hypothetical protein